MSRKIKLGFGNLILLLLFYLCLIVGCGSAYLVVIEHPQKERLKTEKYNKIFVAGCYSKRKNNNLNLAEETVQYLRTELKKNTPFEVLDDKPIKISSERSATLHEDNKFWKEIGTKYESDLLIWGKVDYKAKDASGFRKVKVRSPNTGKMMDVTRYIERTHFDLTLELYFHQTKNGEIVYQDKFNTSLLFRKKRITSLPIFFSLMNRILPDFLGILIPQPSTESRYIIP